MTARVAAWANAKWVMSRQGTKSDGMLTVAEAARLYLQCRSGDVTREHAGNIRRFLIEDRRHHLALLDVIDPTGPIEDLHPAVLLRWQAAIAENGMSQINRRAATFCVRGFIRWCVAQHLIPVDPSVGIRPPPMPARSIRYLHSDQRTELLAFFRRHVGDRPWGLYGLALGETGARGGEMRRIRWRNIGVGHVVLEYTKSRQPRTVPIPPTLARLLAGRRGDPDSFVFPGGDDGHLAKYQAYYWSLKARREPDTPKFRWDFKILRATYATHLLARGIPIEVVSRLLGHSRVDLTLTHYGHLRTAPWFGAVIQALAQDNNETSDRRQEKNSGEPERKEPP